MTYLHKVTFLNSGRYRIELEIRESVREEITENITQTTQCTFM